MLGEDHPTTLAVRANLATALKDAGRLEEAIVALEALLVDYRRVLGEDHPTTLAASQLPGDGTLALEHSGEDNLLLSVLGTLRARRDHHWCQPVGATAVDFNGMAAIIRSSTAIRIETTVPTGATRPITVKTPLGAATSSGPFGVT